LQEPSNARVVCRPGGVAVGVCCRIGGGLAADPSPFVASIYDRGREGEVWGQWLDAERRVRWFSLGLTALWAKCEAQSANC